MYIRELDIPSSRPLQIEEINAPDAVYPGTKIFDLFFSGSKFTDYKEYRGPSNFEGLNPKNFGHWHYIFEKCLADLTDKGNPEQQAGLTAGIGTKKARVNTGDRSYVERWWDALKKVMRLYK